MGDNGEITKLNILNCFIQFGLNINFFIKLANEMGMNKKI